MKRSKRVVAVLVLSMVGFVPGLIDGASARGSDQRCSARGNHSSADCSTLINVGDINITVVASRLLTKTEIVDVKNSFNKNDSLLNIVAIVKNVVVSFDNIDVLGSVCAQKGLLNVCA